MQSIFDATIEGIVTFRKDYFITNVNEAAARTLMCRAEVLIGTDFRNLIKRDHNEGQKNVDDALKDIILDGKIINTSRGSICGSDQLPISINFQFKPLYENLQINGFIFLFVKYSVDAKSFGHFAPTPTREGGHSDSLLSLSPAYPTEIKQSEVSSIFEELSIGMALLSGPDLIFEKVNSAYASLVSEREYIGRSWSDVYGELPDSHFVGIMKSVLETGIAFKSTDTPLRMLNENGLLSDQFYTFIYSRIDSSSGNSRQLLIQAEKTTELALVRQKILKNQRLLEDVVRIANVGFYDFDVVSNSCVFSEQMRADWMMPDGSTFESVTSLIHPDDRDEIIRKLQAAINEKVPFEEEYRVVRPDGSMVWVIANGTADYSDKGDPLRLLGTSVNITKRKLAELEIQSIVKSESARKSSFLANMSHEIRTPLAAILGFADLLKGRNSNEDREHFINSILKNGKVLTRIIDDILDLAKVESGMLETEEIEVSLYEIIDDVLDMFREITRTKGIFLRSHISKKVPLRLLSDPTRLRQILINLVGNAVKFTESGGVTIEIDAQPTESGAMQVEILICDTGIGITAEQQDKIFQPFVQADSTTTRKFGGTGLGLTLSKRLAIALNGDITLRKPSSSDGATFAVTFEAQIPKATVVSQLKSMKTPDNELMPLTGINILIADDSKDNQFLAGRILTKAGAVVTLANDGLEAYRKGSEGSFDLILMDIQMPHMDGYEATKALRSQGVFKPILALSAHAMAEEREKSVAAGCDGHLTKPIDKILLIETILSHTKKRS